MAGINLGSIKKIEKERYSIHDKVLTTFSAFIVNGKKYIQFDMFGNSNRKNTGKVSQILQIDKETAIFFTNLFKKEFNL